MLAMIEKCVAALRNAGPPLRFPATAEAKGRLPGRGAAPARDTHAARRLRERYLFTDLACSRALRITVLA